MAGFCYTWRMSYNETVKHIKTIPRRGGLREAHRVIRVTVDRYVGDDKREFPYVHLREMKAGPNGNWTQTSTGITFRLDEYEEARDALDRAFREMARLDPARRGKP